MTLMRAVSVLCCERKPDWNGSNRSFEQRWVLSCLATVHSSILDRKGRLEMGRKFDIMSGSSPGFLRMGVTAASLSEGGIEPELREVLMISVMSVEIAGRQSLMRWDGMGSRTHVDVFIPVRIFDSSPDDTGKN